MIDDFFNSVTVIVPAYNAETYLGECLDSLLEQAEVGEVVVVDDGSSDGTGAILDCYAAKDGRVRPIYQNNSGVSVARNRGLEVASKRYVTFVDADDLIPKNAFKTLLSTALEFNAAMTYGNFAILATGGVVSQISEFNQTESGLVASADVIARLASVGQDSVSGSCWRILFESLFLKKIQQHFPEGIAMSEDYCFVLGCLKAKPVVAYVGDVVYLVRREGESTTQRFMPDLEKSMDYANDALFDACRGSDLLMKRYWECVANTSWVVCRNMYKAGAHYTWLEKKHELRRVMGKYRESIDRVSLSGRLALNKTLILKIGSRVPSLLWLTMEGRRCLRGGK